jgi:hypothetical protein
MIIIDARSGEKREVPSFTDVVTFNPPWVIRYPDDAGKIDQMIVYAVRPGFMTSTALVEYTGGPPQPAWLPLAVRMTHPSYFLQHVAFIPS